MNCLEELQRLAGLVSLQVPNEMPTRGGRQGGNLGRGFLQLVFTQKMMSGIEDILEHRHRPSLTDHEKLHGGRISIGARGSAGNSRPDPPQVGGDVPHGH